jgi:hypothetical protein
MEKEAKAAWEKLTEAAHTLMSLGGQAAERRQKEVPPPQKHLAKKVTKARTL